MKPLRVVKGYGKHVARTQRPRRAFATHRSGLYLLRMTPNAPVSSVLRRIRSAPRPDAPRGLTQAEAARRTALWGKPPLSSSFWSQVERGKSQVSEGELLRMALAIDARPDEIRDLFHAAGYEQLHDTLVNIGARNRPDLPIGAEAGILTDPRLTHGKRKALLDHLEDILEGLAARGEVRERPKGR